MILLFIFKLYILFNAVVESSIKYCEKESDDKASCVQCQKNFEYDPRIQVNSCFYNNCLDFLYYDFEKDECLSICSGNLIGNSITKVCEQAYRCPQLNEVGQQFHENSRVSKIILLCSSLDEFYQYPLTNEVQWITVNNQVNKQNIHNIISDIITISYENNKIIVWDAMNGQIKTHLQGHQYRIVQCHFIVQSKYLISIGQDGEVITWNYANGQIVQKKVILYGQINQDSAIDLQQNQIITMGFHGEFYDINFQTLEKKLYIGHTEQVTQVFYLSEDHILSVSKIDSRMVLWDRQSEITKAIIHTNHTYTFASSISIYIRNTSTIQKKSYHINIIHIGNERQELTNLCVTPLNVECDNDKNEWTAQIQEKYYLNDKNNEIKDLIIDSQHSCMIVLSTNNLIVYLHDTNIWKIKQTQPLKDIILMSDQIQNQQSVIKLMWTNQNLIIQSDYGVVTILNYQPTEKNGEILSLLKKNIGINGQVINGSIYIKEQDSLISFGNKVISYNCTLQEVNYIISNLQSPIPQQQKPLKTFDFDEKSQLIVNTSDDGQIFIFDFYDGQYIYKLQHPNYDQSSLSSPTPHIIKFIQNDRFCVSFTNSEIICYSSYDFQILYKFKLEEKVIAIKRDNKSNKIIAITLNTASVFDLNTGEKKSTIKIPLLFYSSRFIVNDLYLCGYSQFGDTVLLEYPLLNMKYIVSNENENPEKSILCPLYEITSFDINLTCYKNGLVILRKLDLTFFTQFKYSFSINRVNIIFNVFILFILFINLIQKHIKDFY